MGHPAGIPCLGDHGQAPLLRRAALPRPAHAAADPSHGARTPAACSHSPLTPSPPSPDTARSPSRWAAGGRLGRPRRHSVGLTRHRSWLRTHACHRTPIIVLFPHANTKASGSSLQPASQTGNFLPSGRARLGRRKAAKKPSQRYIPRLSSVTIQLRHGAFSGLPIQHAAQDGVKPLCSPTLAYRL